MANEEQVALLKRGVKEWNEWRAAHKIDLQEADLREVDLRGVNLYTANLREVDLRGANLYEAFLYQAILYRANLEGAFLQRSSLYMASLRWANLSGANISGANLQRAIFSEAILPGANLSGADLSGANLSGADLSGADLRETNLHGANLYGTNLQNVAVRGTVFASIDLRHTNGLDTVVHYGPSRIDVDTLITSGGQIPEVFLRGCGVPDSWIEYLPSLLGSLQPFQYYSCFISYSTHDEAFAQRLHGRLQQAHVRVWYAPHDLKIDKLYPQIDDAIRVYDKLLLILSEESIRSNWVETELRLALQKEREQNRRVLFPVRLTAYNTLVPWRCFDADTGRDLAADVRAYYIGDFSNWKDHDTFEASFARLLNDLKDTAKR